MKRGDLVKITQKLYVTKREDWRKWLKKNHKTAKEIWLVYYRKHTNKPRIPYDDAVEEALCFGWIDGILKRVDDEVYVQRYTPRRPNSILSHLNRTRIEKMIKQKKMTKFGLEKIKNIKPENHVPKVLPMPADLKKALSRNKKAQNNFTNFSPSGKKHYIWWVISAKRKDTRKKRIKETVKRAFQNKKAGVM